LSSSSLENKKIIESLYENCIEEKNLEIPPNLTRNYSKSKDEEKDDTKK